MEKLSTDPKGNESLDGASKGEESFDGTSKGKTFDGTSKGKTYESWWSTGSNVLRHWDESEGQTSEPWWSKGSDDEGVSKGLQKCSNREEWRTTYVYPHRAQSFTDAWIPKEAEADAWTSRDEGKYVWASTTDGGAYVWIPKDKEPQNDIVMRKKKARRGRPQHRPSSWVRAGERARREQEVREQKASLVDPEDVADCSSLTTGDEGSLSRR